jgi:hypothetical protein
MQKSIEGEQVGEWRCSAFQAEGTRILVSGCAKGHKRELVEEKADGYEDLSGTPFGYPVFFKVRS